MKNLILKYLTETLDATEEKRLCKWLLNPKNKQAFKEYLKYDYGLNTIYTEDDIEEAYRALWQKLEPNNSEVKSLRILSWVKYAAAVLLFVSAGIFFLTKNETQIQEPIIVNNNIKTGTNKAILTLEDGTNVTLEENQAYVANNLESNGKEIIYKTWNDNSQDFTYNYLTIPRGGQFFVKLSDGTQVWLNSETQLRYPTQFVEGQSRDVELVYGEAYFDVSPASLHNGSTFKVMSNMQEIEVLGTEFNVKAYKDETTTYTTLVEGKVAVSNTISSKILVPNQQSIVQENNNQIELISVDVYDEIAWKDGIFSFKNKPLKAIARVLSRWYDMDVVFLDKSLENVKFRGVLGKDQSIEEILSAIKSVSINNYEINNKTIILK